MKIKFGGRNKRIYFYEGENIYKIKYLDIEIVRRRMNVRPSLKITVLERESILLDKMKLIRRLTNYFIKIFRNPEKSIEMLIIKHREDPILFPDETKIIGCLYDEKELKLSIAILWKGRKRRIIHKEKIELSFDKIIKLRKFLIKIYKKFVKYYHDEYEEIKETERKTERWLERWHKIKQ